MSVTTGTKDRGDVRENKNYKKDKKNHNPAPWYHCPRYRVKMYSVLQSQPVDLWFWSKTMVDDLILAKCQPSANHCALGAGEQHPARPERVLVQNRRYGVDLRSANAHYV